jgi:hypothetical protein
MIDFFVNYATNRMLQDGKRGDDFLFYVLNRRIFSFISYIDSMNSIIVRGGEGNNYLPTINNKYVFK